MWVGGANIHILSLILLFVTCIKIYLVVLPSDETRSFANFAKAKPILGYTVTVHTEVKQACYSPQGVTFAAFLRHPLKCNENYMPPPQKKINKS